MAQISSTTLFNFTESYEYLINNLEYGIFCKNTYEKLPLKDCGYSAPLVSFCDIPLSLIKEHLEWYGNFGIGINRTYARSLRVHPVWYITSENLHIKNLLKSGTITEQDRKNLFPFLKQYMGYQYNLNNEYKRKRLYNEREWRYISDFDKVNLFLNKKRTVVNVKKFETRMIIDFAQIEYIIVDNAESLKKIIADLKSICKSKKARYYDIISKLITVRNILRDF